MDGWCEEQYLKAKILPPILQILQSNGPTFMQARCLATLANLASNCPQAVEEMMDLEIHELAMEMLRSQSDPQIQSRCLQLLWAFLNSQKMVEEIGTEEMMDVVLEDRTCELFCFEAFRAAKLKDVEKDVI